MGKRIQRIISTVLIFTLIWLRVFLVLPSVWADEPPTPPTAPSAPSAPTAPTAPSAPSVPSVPTFDIPTAPTAPTAPSSPLPPSGTGPTSPPPPTYAAPNTNTSLLPTSNTLPTGTTNDQNASGDSGNTISDSGNTQQAENGSANGTADSTGNAGYSSSSDGASVNDPANINTGPSSLNQAQEIMKKNMEIANQNKADLQNKINAITSSGFNYANFNTMNGQVVSGDSVATLNLLNKLNSNMSGVGNFQVFNVYGNKAGDVAFQFANDQTANNFNTASNNVSKNSVTGPGSVNFSDAASNFTVKEANGNNAKIVNDIVLQSSTGNNSASGNTGDGSVKTGAATAIGNVVNLANTNLNVSQWLFGVVNIFGTLAGNILLPSNSSSNSTNNSTASASTVVGNNATGAGSTNIADYKNTDIATFQNANQADITSNLDVSANTGNNTSSFNTGGGSVTTGNTDASVNNNTIANINTNKGDDTVWMVIVNEMGKWVGYIVGAPWGSTSASNALPIANQTGGTGNQTYSTGTDVTNGGTGPFSYNQSTANNTSNTSVKNDNTAKIENNITAGADTGNNTAEFNTGKGSIETGDAKVGVNLVNMTNTNVTAKKFVVLLVNVVGSFLGNILTPDSQSTQVAGNTGVGGGNNILAPSLTPTTSVTHTGGTETVVTPTPTTVQTNESAGSVQNTFDYEVYYRQWYEQQLAAWYAAQQQTISQQYAPAVQTVAAYRTYTRTVKNKLLQQNTALKQDIISSLPKTQRGLYLSAAFAKATESSFPGILLGGISLRVDQSWIWVVPVAFFIFLIRRRKKFEIAKYLNYLLEVIL